MQASPDTLRPITGWTGDVIYGSLIRHRQPVARIRRRPADCGSAAVTLQHRAEVIPHRALCGVFSVPLLLLLFLIILRLPVKAVCHGGYRCTLVDRRTMSLADDLTAAAAKGNTADVEALLRAGAEVNGINSFGRTALQVMMMGSTPVAQVLLKHGADPNLPDRSTGGSPLHDAARTGFLDTVRLLVQHGADPQARDNTDCRPVDLARDNDYTDVVAFLETL